MAKQLPDNGKSKGGNAAARRQASPPNPRRQRLWRDLALIAIAPLLLYLLASLFTFSPQDPSWSQSGSLTAPVHNMGGLAGAYLADDTVLIRLRLGEGPGQGTAWGCDLSDQYVRINADYTT